MTSAERQRLFKKRQIEAGFVQCNVWLPAHAAPDMKLAAELICADRDLTFGRLISMRTGKLRGLKRP